jgi:hypothetical protein
METGPNFKHKESTKVMLLHMVLLRRFKVSLDYSQHLFNQAHLEEPG